MWTLKSFPHAKFVKKSRLLLIWMETLAIIVAWLLINCQVIVVENFTDIWKHYFLETNTVKFAQCIYCKDLPEMQKTRLNLKLDKVSHM